MDLRENFATDISAAKEGLIKFWNLSPCGSQRYEKRKIATLL